MRRCRLPPVPAAVLMILCLGSGPVLCQPEWPAAEGGFRLQAAASLREWAHDSRIPASQRVAALLAALGKELADPTPDSSHWTLTHPLPQVIQLRLIAGLSEVGNPGALRAALTSAQPEVAKGIVLALAHAGEKGLSADGREVLDEILRLIREDRESFVREHAALFAGDVGLAHPEVVPDIVAALREGLRDPATADIDMCNRVLGEIPPVAFPVREGAWSSLRRLGVTEGVPASVHEIRRAAEHVGFRAAFEALAAVVGWDASTNSARARVGAGTLVRVTVGESVAWINDREVSLPTAATLVAGRLYVAQDLVARVAAVPVADAGTTVN